MAELTSDFCSAYACPMLGVYGVSGKWYCSCHHNANPALNDAITAELHRQKATVDRIVLARREGRCEVQLENGLITLIRDIGEQMPLRKPNVIGPTHAMTHYTEQGS